jgi:hypothetical protein
LQLLAISPQTARATSPGWNFKTAGQSAPSVYTGCNSEELPLTGTYAIESACTGTMTLDAKGPTSVEPNGKPPVFPATLHFNVNLVAEGGQQIQLYENDVAEYMIQTGTASKLP